MRLVGLDRGDATGDLTVEIRNHILYDLIVTDLRARNTREVLMRLRFHGDVLQSVISDRGTDALITDLEALCAAEETVVSHEEFRAARQKREAPIKPVKQRQPDKQADFGF